MSEQTQDIHYPRTFAVWNNEHGVLSVWSASTAEQIEAMVE